MAGGGGSRSNGNGGPRGRKSNANGRPHSSSASRALSSVSKLNASQAIASNGPRTASNAQGNDRRCSASASELCRVDISKCQPVNVLQEEEEEEEEEEGR